MYDEFGRALERLERAREVVRVGQLSGAVGTHAHLSPKVEAYVCRQLQLKPAALATQVLQRDRHAEFVTTLALVGASVERWAQEFRHLQRTEVREVEEFFGQGQKGSSAMPHKRNPIIGERLPGHGTIYLGQNLRFKAPVRIGDTVTAEVRVADIDRPKKRVTLHCTAWVGDKVVIEGDALVLAPSRG